MIVVQAKPILRLSRSLLLASASLGLIACSGCQSWSNGYPMQSPARVAPPATGSFQVPSGYYNPNNSVTYQGAPTGPSNPGIPATTVTQPAGYVQPAGYSAPIQTPDSVGTAGFNQTDPNRYATPGSAPSTGGSSNIRWQ